MHVTMRVCPSIPGLRTKEMMVELSACFVKCKDRLGMKLVSFSIMRNHLHLTVLAESREALSRGMQGMTIRLAKMINRFHGRKGPVFERRYYAIKMRRYEDVKYAMRYVLQNARRHGIPVPDGEWDMYSSGRFNRHEPNPPEGEWPVFEPPASHPTAIAIARLRVCDVPWGT